MKSTLTIIGILLVLMLVGCTQEISSDNQVITDESVETAIDDIVADLDELDLSDDDLDVSDLDGIEEDLNIIE